MAILTFPSILPAKTRFGLEYNTRTFESPLVKNEQTLETPGAKWKANMVFDFLTDDEKRVLAAFFISLNGAAGRFYLFDHSMRTPRGVATGTPLVNGASQTGKSLITDGWTFSITNILRAGDYISYTAGTLKQLHMVTADVNSDGAGNATLAIDPPIRTSPADGAAIVTVDAPCVMHLDDDVQLVWNVRPPTQLSFNINCSEIFNA